MSSPTTLVSARTRAADDPVARIIDAAIEGAPECVRDRVVLPSVDWARVPAPKVARMLTSLERAGVACPRWLSKALLVAGHVVTADVAQHLGAHLKVLHRVNRASRRGESGEEMGPLIDGLIDDASVDGEIVGALVLRLAELGCTRESVRLALAHGHRAEDALRMAGGHVDEFVRQLPGLRLRLTGFSTTQLLGKALAPAFAAVGWRPEVSQSHFGEVLAELVNPQMGHEALVALLDIEGIAPVDWRHSTERSAELLGERVERLASALTAFAQRSEIPLLINAIPCPAAPAAGLLDRRHAMGLRRAVDLVNARLLEVAERSAQIVVIDSDQALAELPVARHVEQKLWFYGRVAYSADATRELARAFAEAWQLVRRGPAKVLAIDLDNTLWGGVYGDDGLERLACGQEFPGNAYLAMQQECLRLRSQGLLLVALSKNNPDVATAFERHPGMALRSGDFAAMAVNWDPKPQNIRKLAADLNLGLDSFLFVDDSPQERDAMRRQCPEVRVPEMPADPAERPLWLRRQACTWPVRLTAEDQSRHSLYAAGREVGQWKATAASHEDFLRGLEQRLIVGHVRAETIPRVAQMHQRTNQFNLTTVRSSEADIAAVVSNGQSGFVLQGRVSDRFGDHGIAIAAVVAVDGDEAVIRSFLMSCRVIGREIERAFLGSVLRELVRRGVGRVRGAYIPTAKNGMVREFYASCGFEQIAADGEKTTWSFDLGSAELPDSKFVTIEWEA